MPILGALSFLLFPDGDHLAYADGLIILAALTLGIIAHSTWVDYRQNKKGIIAK